MAAGQTPCANSLLYASVAFHFNTTIFCCDVTLSAWDLPPPMMSVAMVTGYIWLDTVTVYILHQILPFCCLVGSR